MGEERIRGRKEKKKGGRREEEEETNEQTEETEGRRRIIKGQGGRVSKARQVKGRKRVEAISEW